MNTLDGFEAAALNALAASRKLARSHFRQGLEVDHKSDQSPVTQADRAIEEAMKAVLSGFFPNMEYSERNSACLEAMRATSGCLIQSMEPRASFPAYPSSEH
nr:hypothetical protein [Marinicella sp. W31]MDC2878970.1 hypothetical protein [Marinicella sp. W31]